MTSIDVWQDRSTSRDARHTKSTGCRAGRCGARGDPVGGCGRLAAHPAIVGVGDAEHLGGIGVPVVHELRGVGKNMQDHAIARVSYPVVGAQTANERSRGLPLAGEVMRWLFTGKGMLTYSPSIVAASVKVLEESATPDVHVTFTPGSFKNGQIGELEETPGLSAGAWQMRPLSRGYVEAKSNRPGDAPAINPRCLSEEPARCAIVTAAKTDDHR
jgi:choline dehydrogenase